MAQLHADKKIYAERIHAKKRALERAGVKYDTHDLRRMADLIRRGYSVEIDRQSIARRVHVLAFRAFNGAPERVHIVVFNWNSGQVVIFLDGLI